MVHHFHVPGKGECPRALVFVPDRANAVFFEARPFRTALWPGERRLGNVIDAKRKSLPSVFAQIFGDMPMPGLVYGRAHDACGTS